MNLYNQRWGIFFSSLFFLCLSVLLSSCQKRARPSFSKEDTLQVRNQLKSWRGTLKFHQFLEFTEKPLILTSPLFPSDTTYQGKSEIRKIARLLSLWRLTHDTLPTDSLIFFADSLNPKDTFCRVIYDDFARHCIAIFKYDSLWRIRFRDSVTIETIMKIGFPPKEEEKIYFLIGKREIYLRKEAGSYKLEKFSGFYFLYPKDTAPVIKSITLSQEGRSVSLKPNDFQKPIHLDSLPLFSSEDAIVINISCELPSDTINVKYFCLLYKEGERKFLGSGYNFSGSITFQKRGIGHLFLEIIPSLNLFYPANSYRYTILAIPLKIF